MKLAAISVYQVDLPFDRGPYRLSAGRTWTGMDNTVVRFDTDCGIVGWGESCPFGPNYLEAFAEGVRAGIRELSPILVGQDPSQPKVVYNRMETAMLGHPYVKHAVDMACWDIMGKVAGVPLYKLMGGLLTDRVPTAGGLPMETGKLMQEMMARHRRNGCTQYSCKASGNAGLDIEYIREVGSMLHPGESIKFDANGGWRVDEAIRVMRAVTHLDLYFEQPCTSYEECRAVYRACGRPVILDECALDLPVIVQGINEGVCCGLNLKLARGGGITPSLEIRNVCCALGVPVYIQCTGGNQLTQAAIVHMAHSTPADRLLSVWNIGDLASLGTVKNPLKPEQGHLAANPGAGLGVTPDLERMGPPVYHFHAP